MIKSSYILLIKIAPTPKRGGSHKPYKGITKASA